jgi:AcrR family transcriptional regulator
MPRLRPNISQQSILEAARAVFLEKGILGTTAEVARRAGVSEGSIFNHFRSKAELFRSAMQSHLEAPDWLCDLDAGVGEGNLGEKLYSLGLRTLEFFQTVAPLMMMLWSNQGGGDGCSSVADRDSPTMRVKQKLESFFAAESRAGRLRSIEPDVLSRAFVGAITDFAFTELLHNGGRCPRGVAESFVRRHVDLFLGGARSAAQRAPAMLSRPATPSRTRAQSTRTAPGRRGRAG